MLYCLPQDKFFQEQLKVEIINNNNKKNILMHRSVISFPSSYPWVDGWGKKDRNRNTMIYSKKCIVVCVVVCWQFHVFFPSIKT